MILYGPQRIRICPGAKKAPAKPVLPRPPLCGTHWLPSARGKTMRYVIGVCILTGLIIWDAARNDGRYLNAFFRELRSITRLVGG